MHTPLFVVTTDEKAEAPDKESVWETVDRESLGDYIQTKEEAGIWNTDYFYDVIIRLFPNAKENDKGFNITMEDVKKYFNDKREELKKALDGMDWEDMAKSGQYTLNKATGRYESPLMDEYCSYYTHMDFATNLFYTMRNKGKDSLNVRLLDIYDMHC